MQRSTDSKKPRKTTRLRRLALVLMAMLVVWWLLYPRRPSPVDLPATDIVAGWAHYGGDAGGTRYSPLDQITPENVAHLEIAWTYSTGDLARQGEGREGATAWEHTPILVWDTLFLCTAHNELIALDPETGAERWRFDPELDRSVSYSNQFVCRGVAFHEQEDVGAAEPPCARRILTATNDSRLIAVDASNGRPCQTFGEQGEVDLRRGIGDVAYPGEYHFTSPPAVIDDVIVLGSAVGDNTRVDAPPGAVRAFDALSGDLLWIWDPGVEAEPRILEAQTVGAAGTNQPLEAPAADAPSVAELPEMTRGTPNAWAPLSVDPGLGLVFVPTGNPSPDYWAAHRNGLGRYGSSIVALDASTGELVWAYQTVHNDLWDFDVPAQPTLFDLERDGETIPAVVQATKMGFLFVLDRRTGEELFANEERPVPQTDVPGEITSPTQPFPTELPYLVPIEMTADDAFGFTPWDRGACRRRIAELRFDGMYTPPSLEGTLMYPGNAGGMNWGGVAVDEERSVLVANAMNVAWAVTLFPEERLPEMLQRYPDAEFGRQLGTPYMLMREMLLSPLGIPCTPPPWGTLSVVDLSSGELMWQVPLGTTRDIAPVPIALEYGVPNLGGPVITKGGLIFIAATMDDYLRAYDLATGRELFKGRLPAGGQATPMTYRLSPEGKQYVVIAAGGHQRAGTKLGDTLVAFALRTE